MAIHSFRRHNQHPARHFGWGASLVFAKHTRVVARSEKHSIVAVAATPYKPGTAEFERDLQTFKDLCALTDPTT